MPTSFWIFFSLVTVYLVVLSWCDIRYRRLPNILTVGGAVVALAYVFYVSGWSWAALGKSSLGGVIGFSFLLIPFLLRGAGAGDVKMLLAVGCLVGYPNIFMALIWISICGIVLGLLMTVSGHLDWVRVKHYTRCLLDFKYDKVQGKANLPDASQEKVRIPYGVAIATGTWLTMVIGIWQRLQNS